MTLQEMLDAVLLRSGLSTESSYAANTDDAVNRMVAFANEALSEISRYEWQAIKKIHEFTLSTETIYPLPDDFKAIIPDTFYTQNRLYAVTLINPSDWGYLQATTGGSGFNVNARILADSIQIYQPTDGDVLRFEYTIKYPVLNGTTKKETFTADDDTWKLDDELLIKCIKYKYQFVIGLDTTTDANGKTKTEREFDKYERLLKGQDSGSQMITPGPRVFSSPYFDLWRPFPNTS